MRPRQKIILLFGVFLLSIFGAAHAINSSWDNLNLEISVDISLEVGELYSNEYHTHISVTRLNAATIEIFIDAEILNYTINNIQYENDILVWKDLGITNKILTIKVVNLTDNFGWPDSYLHFTFMLLSSVAGICWFLIYIQAEVLDKSEGGF